MNAQDVIDIHRDQEITATAEQAHAAQIEGRLLDLHTAMPATIVSYDAETQTCVARPATQRLYLTGDNPGFRPLSLCVDVPVIFPAGGAGVLTFPIEAGDECLLVFCERSIDEWYKLGGVQVPQYRLHDPSDAVAIVGISSKPRQLSDVSTTATELRTRDGAVKVSMNAEGITITAPVVTVNAATSLSLSSPSVSLGDGGTAEGLVNATWLAWYTANIQPFLVAKGYLGPPMPAASETSIVKGQ